MTTPLQVQGHGQLGSLMIVGDYPDEKEVRIGKAWENSSGYLLSNMLKTEGVRFGELYKTVYHKNRPPKDWLNEKNKKKREGFEFSDEKLFQNVLKQEIAALRPQVILCCGELSLNYLVKEKGIEKFRGSVLELNNDIKHDTKSHETLVVPTIHPRDLHRNYPARVWCQFDLRRAVKYTQQRYVPPERQYNIWVCRTSRDLKDYLNRVFYRSPYYTTDIETFMGFITCVGFCFDGKEAISIPLLEFQKTSVHERARLMKLIDTVWRSDKPKINQNIKYDEHVSENWGFRYENILDDTMLLQHSCYPELPKGLDFLTSIHTEIPYYKDEGKEFDPSKHEKDQLYLYNAKDCLATWLVYQGQVEDAKTTEVWPGFSVYDFHTQRQWPLYHIYRKIDKAGIRVDLAKREVLKTKYSAMLSMVESSISTAVGFDYNINSPKQSKDIVYEYLNLPPHYKINYATGTRTLTTDEETLEELIINEIDQVKNIDSAAKTDAKHLLQLLLTARHLDGALQWLSIPCHPDGRMYTSTKVTGNETGRTSAAQTTDYGWGVVEKSIGLQIGAINFGMSFQTVPKHGKRLPDGTVILNDLITIFVPDDGYCFVEGDKSQAEARIVVVLADDYDQLQYFDKPHDIHIRTTSWCVDGYTYDEMLKLKGIEKDYDKRKEPLPKQYYIIYQNKPTKLSDARQDIGKPARHAGNYGMGAARLSIMGHMPKYQAEQILRRFHDNAPNIRNVFHAGVKERIEKTGCLVNPYGRKRDFFDRPSEKMFKEAYAQIPQSTISDHVKFDILKPLMMKWYEKGARCLNEKHDSLLWLVPNEMRDDFGKDFVNFGRTKIDFSRGSFIRKEAITIPTDIQYSNTNWKEMKELKF